MLICAFMLCPLCFDVRILSVVEMIGLELRLVMIPAVIVFRVNCGDSLLLGCIYTHSSLFSF